jgi:serine protease
MKIFVYKISLLVWFICGISHLSTAQDRYVPGQILVALQDGLHPADFLPLSSTETNTKWTVGAQVMRYGGNIWILENQGEGMDFYNALQWIAQRPEIVKWQYNHYVEDRAIRDQPKTGELYLPYPNDPLFYKQWHFNNTGQNGGTIGADLGMVNAWDVTNGGITPSGDTVVVAVIDGGLCPYCTDWGDNIWKNYHEIPNDGIDNDGNGFFDDFQGWNVNAQDDNIIGYSSAHGTSVSAVIAAKGNDNFGVTGIMWNTKLMFVAGTSGSLTTESQILGAYDYVYKARKDYNDNQGQKGAFVVSVNCSFGINFGSPSQSPLWCDVLDQLGEAGIVTVAAAANGNWDIDEVGDMPSTCPSPYLISTTSVDHNDEKAPNASFGMVSVDLAAYGTDIYTLSPGSPAYGYQSGTSFAAPQVSGALGLLYTAPCHNLVALAKQSPNAAAFWAKELLLSSVQPVPSLSNISTSGGRLKVDNMLNEYLDQCAECPAPYWLSAQNISTGSAQLTWVESAIFDTIDLRWRKVGDTAWMVIPNVISPYLIENLGTCVAYEFSLRADCNNNSTSSAWSQPYVFTTDGCCLAPAVWGVGTDSFQTAHVFWQPVTAAQHYSLRYRNVDSNTWKYVNGITATNYLIDSLPSCSYFEVQISSFCGSIVAGFSNSFLFQTNGCGACYDKIYCHGQSEDATQEWIEEVTIGNWHYTSLGNQGYQNFTGNQTVPELELLPGMLLEATVVPGFASTTFQEMYRIYVDFNMDGDFNEPDELAFDPGYAHNGPITGNFITPNFTSQGITRMRVIMKYKAPGGLNLPFACEIFPYGQVEDYCVNLSSEPVSAIADASAMPQVRVAPNPFRDFLQVQTSGFAPDQTLEYQITDLAGRSIQEGTLNGNITGLQHLPNGLYLLQVQHQGKIIRREKIVKTY